jgi:carboxylesterase
MRLASEYLASRGFMTANPTLAGHGDGRRLAETRWSDWVRSAEDALETLGAKCTRVAVVGLSMGGLVALELGRRHKQKVHALGLLATALWLPEAAQRFDRFVQRVPFLRRVELPTIAGSDISDRLMRRENARHKVRGMPLEALHSLVEMGQYLKPRLGEITQPALVMHGRNDHTIPFACSQYLDANLGSIEKRLVLLDRTFHVMTLDVEREIVFAAVEAHLRKHLG